FLCYEDYILWRLGAEPVSSYSTASKTMYFDIHRLRWCDALLDACGLRAEQLPTPVPSGMRVGALSREISALTGIPAGVSLVSGGFDQACCALSCGVIHPGDVLDTTGTNEILFFALGSEQKRGLLDCGMNYSQHVVPDVFSSYAMIFNAGGAFRWCRDALFGDLASHAHVYDEMTGGMSDAPERILFLPFLSGIGTPELDSNAKGAFLGLTLSASRFDLAQSILEGVTFEMRYNLELVRGLTDRPVDTLTAVGGATKSDYWLQLKSDVNNVPLAVPVGLEPGACGAAMLAGIGCGAFANAEQAVSACQRHRTHREFFPRPERVRLYEEAYRRYRRARENTLAEGKNII
ncbi:MAG: hypothetical protein GX592_13790, partial [Clostridiales bacterium]|nr:hypothetical protein [Clostridiales bacterium]